MPDKFDSGLSEVDNDVIDSAYVSIVEVTQSLCALPSHRSLALAVTKLDEAKMWLLDRKRRAP